MAMYELSKDGFEDEIIDSWDMEAPELMPAGSTVALEIENGKWKYAISHFFWREGENLDIPW